MYFVYPIMNVLYLDHFNRHGGAQEYILDLADWMAAQGVGAFVNDFDLSTLASSGHRFAFTGFGLLGKNFRRPSFYARAAANLLQLRRFLRREKIDILHCNSIPALALARLARSGQRIVFTCHDCLESPLKIRIVAAAPDFILSVSDAVKKHLLAKGVRKPIATVYNGFPDHGQGAVPPAPKTEVDIGLVARLVPWKGCELFIAAAKRVAATRPQARFHLIGDFEDEAYRRRILGALDGAPIAHVPFIRGKDSIYEMLDVVVNASIEAEPFGRTLVEAGMFRRPAVGPDSGGPAEIIINGVTGLTFATGSADSLAGCLERLVDSPRLRMELGEGARKRFLDTFTVDAIGSKVRAEAYVIRA
jgi:glycosyltransferase involved in cell wall biosynthesis